MRKRYRKLVASSTYRKTIYAYALSVLVIMVFVLAVAFGLFLLNVKRITTSNSQQLLFQLVDSTERIGAGADNIVASIANDTKTMQFLQKSVDDKKDNFYLFLRLREIMGSYTYVADISVINLASGVCVRAVGSDSLDTANQEFAREYLTVGKIAKSRVIRVAGKNENVVSFLQYLSYSHCAVIVDVHPDWFQYRIGKDGIRTVYIIDANGEAVTNNARVSVDGQTLAQTFTAILNARADGANEFVYDDAKDRRMMFFARSPGLDWWFVDLQDYSSFYSTFWRVTMGFVSIELAAAAFFVGLSVVFSRRLRKPLLQLVNRCRAMAGADLFREDDELRVIDRAIARAGAEYNQNETYLRSQFLTNLLLGREMPFQIPPQKTQALQAEFSAPHYCVLLLRIQTLADGAQGGDAEEFKMYRFMVCNLADEIFGDAFRCKAVEMEEDLVGVLLMPAGEESPRECAICFRQLREFVEEQVKITLSGSLGTVVDGQSGIAASYARAKQALEMSHLIGHRKLIDSNDAMYASYQEKNRKLVESIVEYAKLRYSDPELSLKSISQQYGLSSTYIGKIFKSVLGESFSSFLTRYRLEQSRIALRETPKTVGEIALNTGFTNPTYYATVFKSTFGMTPSAFRSRAKRG